MCPSGFSSSSTAEEVTQGIHGDALTAIVTGHIYYSYYVFHLFSLLSLQILLHFWVQGFGPHNDIHAYPFPHHHVLYCLLLYITLHKPSFGTPVNIIPPLIYSFM